jgi:hypothetical protein
MPFPLPAANHVEEIGPKHARAAKGQTTSACHVSMAFLHTSNAKASRRSEPLETEINPN